MAEYYFISQLPSLDGLGENAALPITEARFLELCDRFLGRKAQERIQKLTLSPPKNYLEPTNSPLIDAWNEAERNLRLALGKVRADKMKKPFDTENQTLLAEYIKAAGAAVEIEDPMEAEKFLNRYRLELLELLRPTEPFSEEFVFYYGIKLKLLQRIRQFDAQAGETQYRNFYNSILYGDRLEAKQ